MLETLWKPALPTPHEQANSLLLWVGDNQISPEIPADFSLHAMSAWCGTYINTAEPFGGVQWLLAHLADAGLLEAWDRQQGHVWAFRLTMAGWSKYSDLRRTVADSRTAFMAMKFGDAALNVAVDHCFKPAVARTGFELRMLIDGQGAGLIDDQIRSAILSSRFVIADLSHANPGAYWEAGYAEGAGKQVIYTCEQSIWEKQKTHFDTNHMVTIMWDTATLSLAADKLAATIRATFRAEATHES
jgi:hypothetical protein